MKINVADNYLCLCYKTIVVQRVAISVVMYSVLNFSIILSRMHGTVLSIQRVLDIHKKKVPMFLGSYPSALIWYSIQSKQKIPKS